MKRLAAVILATLGLAVSSFGAAQSVKFAVGQTWTGTFQGFGAWTVRFTELDSEGDPMGITSAGPDERTAGGFDNSGRPAFYTIKNGDGIICYASSATAQNGVYSGVITRQQGNATPQKLGTPCTFSQAGSASSLGGSSAVWPPALSVGTSVKIETRSVWTGTLTGLEKTDWVGKVSTPSGGVGKMYGYLNDDGSYEFQVVNTSAATAQFEYCTFERTSMVSPGVYTGDRYYAANKDAQAQPDGNCRVTIGNAVQNQVNPQPNPTPSGVEARALLRVNVALRVETRQIWASTISGKDSDGDWTGKATSADGKSATLFTFAQDDGSFAFQIAYASSELCVLPKSGAEVSAGIYAGKRYFKVDKNAKYEPDGDCRVTFGAASSQVSPQPQPQLQAVGPALPWPSNIAVGQTWRVVITGAQALSFTLNLTGLDEFETPSGRLGAQTISMFPSRSQEATVIEIIGSPGTPIISCTFKGATSVRGQSLVGGKVQTRVNRGSLPVEQSGTCEATLVSGGSAAVTVAPVAPTPVAPVQTPQTGTPPVTSAWPLKLEVGQSWRAEIQGLGSWVVNFKILDRDGYPQGSAVPNGSGLAFEAAFFYFQNDNDMRLKLTSGNTLYRCIFERNEISGLVFSGWRYVDSADGKSLDKTAQRCTMQYIGRVTLSNLVDPLAGFASSVADSHSSK